MISDELKHKIEVTRENHPFITFLIVGDEWKCGVVQNSNNRFITMYDLAKVPGENALADFLKLADRWWWESNMGLPINAFIGPEFDAYRDMLITLPKKTMTEDPIGPVYSLKENYLKRIKKTRIELVKRRKD